MATLEEEEEGNKIFHLADKVLIPTMLKAGEETEMDIISIIRTVLMSSVFMALCNSGLTRKETLKLIHEEVDIVFGLLDPRLPREDNTTKH